jgi:DNA-binding SARP family transcriptional activator
MLKLFLFGPPRVERDGRSVKVSRRRVMALFAFLAVTRQSHTRNMLASMFWPDHDEKAAKDGLRRVLHRLRKEVGAEWIQADRRVIGIQPRSDLYVDVHHFCRLLSTCRECCCTGGELCSTCLKQLDRALALYQDDFLHGFCLAEGSDFEYWQTVEREKLRQSLTDVLYQLVEHAQYSNPGKALTYAQSLVALNALDERAHRYLMRLFVRQGQSTLALKQYQICWQALEQELGVPPQLETEFLYRRILDERAAGVRVQ